jgi:ATP-binding protein involved in chromosome partitioning
MTLSRETVLGSLRNVIDPISNQDIVAADLVRALVIDGAKVRFVLEVAPENGPKMEPTRYQALKAVEALAGTGNVNVVLTAHSTPKTPPDLKIGRHPTPQAGPSSIPGVKHIIAVASGKGGVGKSTVSANLAVALQMQGYKTGLLDADIHGPSQTRMMGVSGRPASPDGKTIIPLKGHGVTMMTIGLMLPENEAVIWRGPMLMGALQQLIGQVEWGNLDYLIIDLPPGTGDVQLSLVQKTILDGVVIVSTPQDIALMDARKAMAMFTKLNTKMLGMIENMSAYICPNCGHEAHIFGHGGAKLEAEKMGLPFLGEVPLTLGLRESGDAGLPIVVSQPDSAEAQAFVQIAKALVKSTL